MKRRSYFYFAGLVGVLYSSLYSIWGMHIAPKQTIEEEQLFDLSLKTQFGKVGTSYKLKCMVKAKAVTFWTVDGKVPDGLKLKILPDSNLLIRNISQEDYEREYFCHAILPGQTTVESMQIILEPPRESKMIELELQDDVIRPSEERKQIFAIVGELKTLSCSVHARPYPDFKWLYKNGTIIQNKTDFIISSYEDVSNLTIFMRSADYYADYRCEAWNNLGKTEMEFSLEMPKKPEEIPFIYPKSIGLTKIVLGVMFDKSKNYSVYVQYQKANDLDWTGSSMKNSDESLILTNLQPNTTYLIKAAFTSDFVLGDYSEAIRVTTDKIHLSKDEVGEPKVSQSNEMSARPRGRSFNDGEFDVETNKVINTTAWTSTKIIHSGNKMFIKTTTIEEVDNDFV